MACAARTASPSCAARKALPRACITPGRRSSWKPASARSEEHTSELQSLMRISYAVFCLKKKTKINQTQTYLDNFQMKHCINNHKCIKKQSYRLISHKC